MAELEGERERRWKAEQAAGRLVEHVQSLQSQLGEAKRKHELVVARAAHLEGELEGEREKGQRLQTQIQQLQVCVSTIAGVCLSVCLSHDYVVICTIGRDIIMSW